MNISDFRALDEHAEAFAVTMKAEKFQRSLSKQSLTAPAGHVWWATASLYTKARLDSSPAGLLYDLQCLES